MEEEEYQAGLDALRRDWGSVSVDPRRPGVLIAANDPTTGLTAGYRAPIFAEIINRALKAEQSNRVEELVPCAHGIVRERAWCEPCFRKEQHARWGYSPWDFCDYLNRGHG